MKKSKEIVLIPGDGIGPEISDACIEIIDSFNLPITWTKGLAGAEAVTLGKEVLPAETLNLIAKCGIAYKGPVGTPIGGGHRSVNVTLRKHFTLFANLRPVKSFPGIKSRYHDIDMVIVRENTEDLYSGIEHVVVPGVVESIKVITAEASERVARFTFEYCRKHGRKKVTAVHKANIMKLSDGLFLQSVQKIRQEFPEIEYNEIIVDNLCNQLVLNPEKFDVLLCQNLYGDIVSDLCAGLVGGLGVVPGANLGKDCAIFEAVHGTAPDIAGRGIANPTAMLLSGCLMLDFLGHTTESKLITDALAALFARGGDAVTQDLGGKATTKEFVQNVIAEIRKISNQPAVTNVRKL